MSHEADKTLYGRVLVADRIRCRRECLNYFCRFDTGYLYELFQCGIDQRAGGTVSLTMANRVDVCCNFENNALPTGYIDIYIQLYTIMYRQ